MNEVATRIFDLIFKKGISQSELAKRIGVSKNAVQNWKNENVYPTLAVIDRICEATEITLEQFFHGMGRKDNMSSEEKFLDNWRLLNNDEKLAILQTIKAFRKDRAVKND